MGLKIGIIGFGGMAHWHASNAGKLEGVEFLAAYDVDEQQLVSAEKEFGMKPCRTLDELLNIPEINFVLVATPNQVHKELVIAALRAGKNVMTEKPATLSVADWDEMVAVSRECGKLLTVHQNRRWDKDYRVMREVIENDTIGKVYSIESRVFGTVGGMYGWRAFKEYGGGMVLDWGVHLFDQLLWMYPDKKIVDVKAELMSLLEANREVDDYFKVMLKLEDGPVLTVEVGSYAFRALPRWYCIGDNGTLQIDDFSCEKGGITRPRFGAAGNVAPVVVQTPAGPTRMMAPPAPGDARGAAAARGGGQLDEPVREPGRRDRQRRGADRQARAGTPRAAADRGDLRLGLVRTLRGRAHLSIKSPLTRPGRC